MSDFGGALKKIKLLPNNATLESDDESEENFPNSPGVPDDRRGSKVFM